MNDARIQEAYRHCEGLIREQDKDHYLAALFVPASRRPYLFALYAFALEIARVKTLVKEPMAGVIRLQWWLEAIAGLRAEEAAASPVMIALQDAAKQTNIPLAPLAAAVEARQAEFQGAPAAAAAAVIFMMATRFLGGDGDGVAAAAQAAAEAVSHAISNPDKARAGYRAFLTHMENLPEQTLPAFLPVALVPLRLKHPEAPQWRRQIALLRAVWFGFAKI